MLITSSHSVIELCSMCRVFGRALYAVIFLPRFWRRALHASRFLLRSSHRGRELHTFGGPTNSTVQSSNFRSKALLANFPNFRTFQTCESLQIELLKKQKCFLPKAPVARNRLRRESACSTKAPAPRKRLWRESACGTKVAVARKRLWRESPCGIIEERSGVLGRAGVQ